MKTTEAKSLQSNFSATTISYSRNQTQTYSSNFQEQRTTTSGETVTSSVERQNGAAVGRKLTRPKSQLYKEARSDRTTASKAQENVHFREAKGSRDAMAVKTVIGTNFAFQQKPKQKPPPVLPKPKRNKGRLTVCC